MGTGAARTLRLMAASGDDDGVPLAGWLQAAGHPAGHLPRHLSGGCDTDVAAGVCWVCLDAAFAAGEEPAHTTDALLIAAARMLRESRPWRWRIRLAVAASRLARTQSSAAADALRSSVQALADHADGNLRAEQAVLYDLLLPVTLLRQRDWMNAVALPETLGIVELDPWARRQLDVPGRGWWIRQTPFERGHRTLVRRWVSASRRWVQVTDPQQLADSAADRLPEVVPWLTDHLGRGAWRGAGVGVVTVPWPDGEGYGEAGLLSRDPVPAAVVV